MYVNFNNISNVQPIRQNKNLTKSPVTSDIKSAKKAEDILSAMNITGSQVFNVMKNKKVSFAGDKVQKITNGNVTTTTSISGNTFEGFGQKVPECVKITTETVKPDGKISINSTITKPIYEINGIKDLNSKAFNHINKFAINGHSVSGCHNSSFYEQLLDIPSNDTLKAHLKNFGFERQGEYTIQKAGNGVNLTLPVQGGSTKTVEIEKVAKDTYTTAIDGVKVQKTCCANSDELKEFYTTAMKNLEDKSIPKIVRSKDIENPLQMYFEMPVKLANGTKKIAAGYLDLAKKIPVSLFPIDKPTVNRMYHSLLK
jgi:hypothetical protein